MFAASKTAAVSGATPDPQFNYVTMLLHGDGTNGTQNNTFIDSSTNNFTITRNGNTTQGSFSPYGSNWSTFVGVDNNLLSVPSNAAFAFGTGDFTVEGWFYQTDDSTYPSALEIGTHTAGGILFITKYTGVACIYAGGFFGSTTTTLNAWNHIAWVRSSGVLQIYVNGVGGTSAAFTNNLTDTATVTISNKSTFASTYKFNGNISNLRVVKGTAVYTSNFTPSKTPLTAISGTSLLTCQSNRFIDNSSNAFAITVTGTPSIQRFNPFGTSTSYSTSVIGGSGYFDGTGDYLNVTGANCALTGDFTVESWVYPTTWGSYQRIVSGGTSTFYWTLGFSTTWGSGLLINWYDGSDYYSSSYSPGTPLNTWYHVAVVRTGSTLYYYINGTRFGTSAYSSTPGNSSGGLTIGRRVGATEPWYGYMTDTRIVLGTNVYGTGTTCTVPTAPLTAITNTQLLTGYTNGAIYDNAMMNDLETVGNAQISTSVVKYGTGSIALDGTGDYLTSIATPNIELGSGDYTIECWVNISAAASYGTIISKGPAGTVNSTFWSLEFAATSNSISYFVYSANSGAYIISGTSNIKTSTWIHLAVCRSGNNTRLFVNGTQEGSTYTSGYTIGFGNSLYIGSSNIDTTRTITGYIDDLRVTKGYARYTTNFTAPTAAFPNTGPV